ncbi:MAG: hypothetical protein AAF485_15710 [Chloroflexota bacterium]
MDKISTSAHTWLEENAATLFECLGSRVACDSTTPNELPIQRDFVEPFMRDELSLDDLARVNVCEEADRPFVVGVWHGTKGMIRWCG